MDKSFSPSDVEPRWRARWEELGVGIADVSSDRPSFSIALPPPNITGALHAGHALQQSVQDILARHHRMRGYEVEWCPGTDHAAIATQNVIERQLAAEGTTKEELGRERFQARVDAWYEEYGGRIFEQMRRLGFSCDWSRARFTLDPAYVRAIRVVFKELYDSGLIYRGPRIVNWCPRCGSAISDEEVEWQEHTDSLVSIRYPVEGGGEIVIATVRPETMLGDTGVAVSPGDPRYAALVGRTVILPLTGRGVPIIEDAAVEPQFGTGALKVTPAHDPTDYDIGQRHALPMISVIALDGTMDVPDLPLFHGLTVNQARVAVTEALRELGLVVKEEEYVHSVGHCDRCKGVLEPLISEQWWVRMRPLAEPAIAVVESEEVRFHPRRFAAVYLDWMRNIRDWCISRQLWLGHAIPVSTCGNGHRFAWIEHPSSCPECGSTELRDDPDVLDTWFSSALWPFAIFGWPDDTPDLRRFYPTDVLVTAREIIFLWVARMVMTGLRFAGARPFSDVIINSTILAGDGSRMSKSKGNVVDPLDMIERYGADAVRAWAGAVGTSGQDMRFDENRIASYKLFANKLWNATRLLVTRLGDGDTIAAAPEADPETLHPEDRWILARVAETVEACDAAIAGYRFHEVMERLYDVTWHGFCDWYVEMIKGRLADDAEPASRAAATWTAVTVLDTLLRTLHPLMPFVTEECAVRLPGAAPTLQRREWPAPPAWWRDGANGAASGVDRVIELVGALRNARHDAGLPNSFKERQPVTLRTADEALSPADLHRLVRALVPVEVVDELPTGATPVRLVAGGVEAAMHTGGVQAVDRARLERQLRQAEDQVKLFTDKLANPGFMKAPPHVVEGARRSLAEAEAQRDTVRRLLDGG
ncbi:MAG TPA: valine--tRNA ligase [Candidatus Dormibacteraeota bacterium]|nr:valine--tRNA ligase [Candidatus Dormibacteraeota bacterium]